LYIPGFGDVSTPAALSKTLAANPGTKATASARAGILGPLAPKGAPGYDSPLNQLVRAQRARDATSIPDPGPTGSTAGINTTGFQYDAVLPPLSPEMQRAFAERRRLASRQFEETTAANERQRLMAEAAAVQGRRQVSREQGEQSRAGMQELAGRGLARAPMFVNPFQRGVVRAAQQRLGELETGLAGTLENLRSALQQADIDRERELSQIEFDMLAARSDIPRLLGAG
jgi:hypothetical protein